MIKINLLPIKQIKKRARIRNEAIGLLSVFVIVLLGIGLVGYVQASKITTLNNDIAQLNQKKASFAPIIKEIEELKKYKANLEAKIETIKKLRKGSLVSVRVIDEIANKTPANRVWLTNLDQSVDSVKLQGVALDNATIAQYMQSIIASPFFLDAELQNSSLQEKAGVKLISFTLTVSIDNSAL